MIEAAACTLTGKNKEQWVLSMKGGSKTFSQVCSPELAAQWQTNVQRCMAAAVIRAGEKAQEDVAGLGSALARNTAMARRAVFSDRHLLGRILSFVVIHNEEQKRYGLRYSAVCKVWNATGNALIQFMKSSTEDNEENPYATAEEGGVPSTLIIDHGSHFIKIGLSSTSDGAACETPLLCFPSSQLDFNPSKDERKYGMNRQGDQDAMDALVANWEVKLKEAKIDPTKHPVVVACDPGFMNDAKRRLEKSLFTRLNVPAVHLENSAVCVAYSYGSLTGLIVELGFASCRVTPIYQGTIIEAYTEEVRHLSIRKMANLLARSLKTDHSSVFGLATPGEIDMIALRLLMKQQENVYTKSNGMEVKFDATPQVEAAMRLLFDPKTVLGDQDTSIYSLPELILRCIGRCELDTRADLYGSILLAGGGAIVMGEAFADALTEDLKAQSGGTTGEKIQVLFNPNPVGQTVWNGGQVLSTLENFSEKFVTRWVFDEREQNASS